MKKSLAVAVLALALLAGCGSTPDSPSSAAQQCEEDQPCWDCETMGDGECGQDLPTGVVLLPSGECPLFVRVCSTHLTPWVVAK